MSQDPDKPSRPPRRRTTVNRTVYCLFASQKSFSTFQAYHTSKKTNLQTLRKTEESSHSDPDMESQPQPQLQLTPVPQVRKLYHCRKCFKQLSEQEEQEGSCEQCVYLELLVQSGNFQRFISVLIDFKVQYRQPITSQYKLRRIDSIQSIQSFTLDRMHDSQQIRSNFQYYNLRKDQNPVLNSMENSMKQSKKSEMESVVGGGYFCNGCGAEPIVGRRFHCLTCEDYDLCERCYFYTGHKHDMKTFKDMREEIANRARGAIKRSDSLQNTLPFLSSSIRDFEKANKLFKTTALKKY